MNFILAFLFMLAYYAFTAYARLSIKWFVIIEEILANAIVVNIGLGVFNLIPIPPLDGSKVFRRFLPYKANDWLDRNMQMIYIIFLILWITDILSWIVSPIINQIMHWMSILVAKIFMLF